jgi:hypothetical protein
MECHFLQILRRRFIDRNIHIRDESNGRGNIHGNQDICGMISHSELDELCRVDRHLLQDSKNAESYIRRKALRVRFSKCLELCNR